jgi:amino acid adenylation domain-containing protein/thioester reductase-like protein
MRMQVHERNRILFDWQGRRYALPDDTTILDLFEARARSSAADIAVMFGDRHLTYAELDGNANSLAATLQGNGVSGGEFTPVIMENGLELLISFLALMKIGAPFVPLDPTWPIARTRSLLGRLNGRTVLTRDASDVPDAVERNVILVDQRALGQAACPPRERPRPDSAIYGFFTSGSTGLPKCAVNLHKGILNRLLYMNRVFHPSPADVVLQNSSPVFDSSIWQLFWPLINGARVVIPTPSAHFDLRERVNLIYRTGTTLTDFVPSVFNLLVRCMRTDDSIRAELGSLRQLLIGGEEMDANAVHEFMSYLPRVGVTNTYGPTETSIGVMFYELCSTRFNPVPIGRPIDNVHILILDERLQLVEVGEVGEIYIGGVCLGAGYLNDPGATNRAFIPNPYPEVPGDKLYKTGDLAFYLQDGLVQFVGRRDHQIKLGGIRVDLGEIEHAMRQCDGVRQAAVVVDVRNANMTDLVAFVGCTSSIDENDLHRELGRKLPKHMMPKRYVLLDALPLSHNGKVDRQALKELVAGNGSPSTATPPPQLATDENTILAVFRNVLGRDDIDLNESFFCMGGDSLRAIEATLQIGSAMGCSLSADELYAHPSVRKLAELLSATRRAGVASDDMPGLTRFEKDVSLANHLGAWGRQASVSSPRSILLTGATGFLGAHVLAELVRSTDATVYCLVRAATAQHAEHALARAMGRYAPAMDLDLDRVRVLTGDVSRPRLGLAPEAFDELAERVDTVLHCAAQVNLAYGYTQLRDTNVLGMQEIIGFAATHRVKWVVHASSVTALPLAAARDGGPPLAEDYLLAGAAPPAGGYNQSKWVQERILTIARARGIPCSVVRFGEIMPSRARGVPNPCALSSVLIAGCLALGVYPSSNARFDYMPADDAARAMIHIAWSGRELGRHYNVVHETGARWNDVMEGFRPLAHRLSPVSFHAFRERLSEQLGNGGATRELRALSLLLADEVPEGEWLASHLLCGLDRFSRENTRAALAENQLTALPVSPALLQEHAAAYCDDRRLHGEAGGAFRAPRNPDASPVTRVPLGPPRME